MGAKEIVLVLILAITLAAVGCTYSAPQGDCTPPAVKMLDVNGNSVCVLPEIGQGNQSTATTNVPSETGATTTEPVTPVTGNTVATTTETTTTTTTGSATLPKKTVVEGDLVSFPNLKAVDPDGRPIKYSFTAPLDAQGEWQTKKGDAGEHTVTITASDGENTISQDVLIEVTSSNQPPVIKIDSAMTVKEGDLITLSPIVSDPDGDKVTVTYSGWMTTNKYQTTYDDAGNYIVTITATDGVNTVSKDANIIVQNVNRAPIVAPLADVTVSEGDKVIIEPTVTDPDGDKLKISFGNPLDSTGSWQTKIGDAGTYKVDVSASDGNLTTKRSFTVTVKSSNKAPVIKVDSPVNVKEGDTVTLNPVVTDPEGDKVTVTYSGWMTSSTYKTTFDDSGTHTVTVTATDGINTVTQDVEIIVQDVNRPPSFVPGAFT